VWVIFIGNSGCVEGSCLLVTVGAWRVCVWVMFIGNSGCVERVCGSCLLVTVSAWRVCVGHVYW